MSRQQIREIRQRELAEARARNIARLQEAAGPALSASAAQQIMEQARAWPPTPARAVDRYFAEYPDALTSPSPHCSGTFVRLLRQMDVAGHGDAVTQLGCAVCGRIDGPLPRPTPAGRCCHNCADRGKKRLCARCNKEGRILARRPEGPICQSCYRRDPQVLTECAECGRRRLSTVRREDGSALCQSCAPAPERECVCCGAVRRTWTFTTDGPVCDRCYKPAPRLCGICGEVRPIQARAVDGQPDICEGCYRGPLGECVVCRRQRHGRHVRALDGAFHCYSCGPRPSRRCDDCGETKPVKATWPIGILCGTCYHLRSRNPAPCSRCGADQVLVGRTPDGGELCGPCSGADHLAVACRRCGFPGDIYADGTCTRCMITVRLTSLLSGEDGAISPQLLSLTDSLGKAERPWSVLGWIRESPAAQLLATLAADHTEISHDVLDALPQDRNTRYIREVLVAAGALPQRQENLARLELWVKETVENLPSHQARIIRPFAEWNVVCDARRRATRGRYTSNAAAGDRHDVRVAIEFLTWLDAHELKLDAVGQEDLDLWLTTHPTRRRGLASFIRWTTARRLTGKITVPPRPKTLPSRFLDEDEYSEQLRRCLNDDTLPLEVRIAGALIRLYALPATRIVELTTDRFHREDDGAYLILDRNPVLLPPRLAQLIEQQATRPGHASTLRQQGDGEGRFLLPGRPPSRPRSAASIHSLMNQYELPVLSARNTAMIEAVADLPPIVVADLFGIHPNTAHSWAQYAQDSWADYLAACQDEG